jgi:L-threonylcarbamoyladenylate synthase
MNLFKATEENIKKAADIIRKGGLVSFPTETVYGLGADALNETAVAGIFEAKQRPSFDPLIVHVDSIAMMEPLIGDFPDKAYLLAEKFWPGPLTLVVPRSKAVPDIVTSGLPTVAIRMPDHEVARDLIHESAGPIAAPSANPFGYLSPTTAQHVHQQLGQRVDMILDGGSCSVGVESTIILCRDDELFLLRPGGISIEEIEDWAGPVQREMGEHVKPIAPGQLPWHYAPLTKIEIIEKITEEKDDCAYLYFKDPQIEIGPYSLVLSEDGNLRRAAASVFSALHKLDKAGKNIIYVEEVPQHGLGLAIMDRLRKAAQKGSHS